MTDIGKFLPNMEDLSENTDNQQDSSQSLPFQLQIMTDMTDILYIVKREYSFKLTNSNSETI